MEKNNWNVRCGNCGKFISEKDIEAGLATVCYYERPYETYSGISEEEVNDSLCKRCKSESETE